jgi:[ribosomal protein S18]-alanine N-acetyltransferase
VNPHLRPAAKSDLAALLEIERDSFPQPHWSAEDFLKYSCTVAEVWHQLAGFIVVRETFPGDQLSRAEREILNVAIALRFRHRGVATLLLRNELRSGAIYFLEVRESNSAAQALYRKLGFIEIARRKKYYHNPTETAIVMQMK